MIGNMSESARNPTTVAAVLELAEVQAGRPKLAAGAQGLGREVRWAHVAADSNIAQSVDGGELVLMTAHAWPAEPERQARFTNELIDAGISAIALELGAGLTSAPEPMRLACERRAVPLIVLHQQVRFVQITQRLHQRILAEQNEALEAREHVHRMLTELGLNRSPVDYVIERLAATIGAPVVLEDAAHRVVAIAELGADTEHVLNMWNTPGEPQLPEGSVRVPVEARGTRWGTLTALAGPAHAAGRTTVLELGAFALALGRISGADTDQWLRLADRRVFEALLSGRYRNHTELAAQLAAANMPLDGPAILAVSLRSFGNFGAHESLERTTCETALRRAVAPHGKVLIGEDPDRADGTLLALVSLTQSSEDHAAELATRIDVELGMLVPNSTPANWQVQLNVGGQVVSVSGLIATVELLRKTGGERTGERVGRVLLHRVERQPLAQLIRSLTGSPELHTFAEATLQPLIEHDRTAGVGHTGDLLAVLAATLAHPSNRSKAAEQSRVSRSVYYGRLQLIEELLGVDLTDGHTLAALTVALLAHQAESASAASPS